MRGAYVAGWLPSANPPWANASQGRGRLVRGEHVGTRRCTGFGRLDIYFANAGVSGSMTRLSEVTVEEFQDVFRVACLRERKP